MKLIFDLDGTLVDSAPGVLATLAYVTKEHRVHAKKEISSNLIGHPLKTILEELCGSSDPGVIEPLECTFKEHYDTTGVLQTSAYEQIDQMLCTLQQMGHSLYIATNKRKKPTIMLMNHFKLDRYFKGVFSLDTFSPPMPDKAALLQRILSCEALLIEETIYVGDRPEDGQAARINDLKFLHAVWGYGPSLENDLQHVLYKPADIFQYV